MVERKEISCSQFQVSANKRRPLFDPYLWVCFPMLHYALMEFLPLEFHSTTSLLSFTCSRSTVVALWPVFSSGIWGGAAFAFLAKHSENRGEPVIC